MNCNDQCRATLCNPLFLRPHPSVLTNGYFPRSGLHRLLSPFGTVGERVRTEYFQSLGLLGLHLFFSRNSMQGSTFRSQVVSSSPLVFCSGCTFCAFMSLTPEAENIELDLRWTEWWRCCPPRNAASVVITGWDFFHNSGYSWDSVFSSFVTYNIKPVFHLHIRTKQDLQSGKKKKLHPLLTSPLENHCFPCVAYVSPWTCPCLPQETFSVPIRSVYLCPPRSWTRTLTPLELITTAYLEHLRIHTHTCTCMYLN